MAALHRFQAARPIEMQHIGLDQLAPTNGPLVAIACTLDDHSRLLVGTAVCRGHGTAEQMWPVVSDGIEARGVPMTSLSGNYQAYSLRRYRDAGEPDYRQRAGLAEIEDTCSLSN